VPPYALHGGYAERDGDGGLHVDAPSGRLEVRRADGSPIVAQGRIGRSPGHRGHAWRLSFDLAPDEGCFAWGQHALPLDRRGHPLVSWNVDIPAYPPGPDGLYGTYPLLLCLRGGRAHGLLWNDPHRTVLDLRGDRAVLRSDGGAFDLFVLAGPAPADVLRQLGDVAGRAPLWPRWALGLHHARWGWKSSEAVRRVVDGYRERRLPLSVVHLDIDHMDGFRDFTFDPHHYGDAPALLRELAQQGVRVVTIADVGLKRDPDWEPDADLLARGLEVRGPDGSAYTGPVWPGDCHFPDFTSEAARAWWAGRVAGWIGRSGASGIWLDMNEPSVFGPLDEDPADGTIPPASLHDLDGTGGDHRSAHNVYGMLGARACAEGLADGSGRAFVLSRSGYCGLHRYAASWTGDNDSTWEHLRLALEMTCSFGLAGQPFAGADIGGFAGHPEPELYVRFLQAGVLMPLMRIHCANTQPDREPWRFGPEVEEIAAETLALRAALVPYLYDLVERASRTGAPVLRPLWWDAPGDARLRAAPGAYLLGHAIVAAPALGPGVRRVDLPLPAGSWRAWNGASVHVHGAVLGAPLGRLPLLVRCGAALPLGPGAGLRVDVDPQGGPIAGEWYEDDGETYAHADGAFRRVRVRGEGGPLGVRLEIEREGAWRPADERLAVEVHGIAAPLRRVAVDGKETGAELRQGVVRLSAVAPSRIEIAARGAA
jgi:alpha-glucosidase